MTRSFKTAFITGAGRGIGRACAERFAAAGYFVGLYDIDLAAVEALAGELVARHGSGACCFAELDVRHRSAIARAVEHFSEETGGRMDLLINNAGVMSVGRFEDIEPPDHRRMIAVNFRGVVEVAQASFELLRKTPGSRLINMSSASAVYGVPEMAVYSATKHAVRGFTEALEVEWAGHGITVRDVMPIFVDTALLSDTRKAAAEDRLGVHLRAEDVAEVVFEVAHSRSRRVHWPVGAQAKLVHYVSGLVPAALERFAAKLMAGM